MPMTLPRPDLADRLGVTYRRIPVMAIGNDVYCDSSLIAAVLERRFPPSAGFGTLFPKRKGGGNADTGVIKAFSMTYADRVLGTLGSQMLPYHKFKQDFLDDRTAVRLVSYFPLPAWHDTTLQWFGKKVDPQAITANQPVVKSWLSSHLVRPPLIFLAEEAEHESQALLEEQLVDGRDWLMDTETPSLADLSVHYVWEWMLEFRPLRHLKDLFDPAVFPRTVAVRPIPLYILTS